MTDITIPPEAVDRAAQAICETENGPCKCMPDECGCIYWKAHATAALRAGIAAWPGSEPLRRKNGQGKGVFLPFPKEGTSD
jgi:hypothetical protein